MKKTYITPAIEMVMSQSVAILAGTIEIKNEYSDDLGLTTCAPSTKSIFDDSNDEE